MIGSGVCVPLATAFVEQAGFLQNKKCVCDPQVVGDGLVGALGKMLKFVLAGEKGLKQRQ